MKRIQRLLRGVFAGALVFSSSLVVAADSCWVVNHPDGSQAVLEFSWNKVENSDVFPWGAEVLAGSASHSVCGVGTVRGLVRFGRRLTLYTNYDGCAVAGQQYIGGYYDAYIYHYWYLELLNGQGGVMPVDVEDCTGTTAVTP